MPRAPGGCHSGRVFVKTSYVRCSRLALAASATAYTLEGVRTGPRSTTGVKSSTFSIGALEWSCGGGSRSVTRFAILLQFDDSVLKSTEMLNRTESHNFGADACAARMTAVSSTFKMRSGLTREPEPRSNALCKSRPYLAFVLCFIMSHGLR